MAVIMSKQMAISELTYWEKYSVGFKYNETVSSSSGTKSLTSSNMAYGIRNTDGETHLENYVRNSITLDGNIYLYNLTGVQKTASEAANYGTTWWGIAIKDTVLYYGKVTAVSGGQSYITYTKMRTLTTESVESEFLGIVASTNPYKYPDNGIQDGYKYVKVVA